MRATVIVIESIILGEQLRLQDAREQFALRYFSLKTQSAIGILHGQ